MNNVIIVGGSITGLALTRAYSKIDCNVFPIIIDKENLAEYSKYAKKSYYVPYENDLDCINLIEFLEKNCNEFGKSLVIPDNDFSALILSKHKKRLDKKYEILTPEYETIRICNDKKITYQYAKKAGIPVPQSHYPTNFDGINEICEKINFPCLMKPRVCFFFKKKFQKKAFFIKNSNELINNYMKFENTIYNPCISEIIPGGTNRLYFHSFYINKNRKLIAEVMDQKIRESPPIFGTGCVMKTIEIIPEIKKLTLDFVKIINYQGFGMIEYKHSIEDNKYYLLDFNPRPPIMYAMYESAGMNFAEIIFNEKINKKQVLPKKYNINFYWINLLADIYYYLLQGKKNNVHIKEFIKPYFKKKVFASFDLRDIKPFLVNVKRNFDKLYSR